MAKKTFRRVSGHRCVKDVVIVQPGKPDNTDWRNNNIIKRKDLDSKTSDYFDYIQQVSANVNAMLLCAYCSRQVFCYSS